ncbi:MAG: transporter [Acidimicrobiales bacterium]
MIRLAWRQFRTEATVGIGVLVVVAVVLAVTGPHLVSVYRTAPSQLSSTYSTLQGTLPPLLLIAPALLGIFFGAPLIARELETGTYRLAWTQSATRSRWLVTKLALVGLVSSLLAGGLSLMVAWWANPLNIMNENRFSPANFGVFGIVPFGYALFAFALGATTGLLFRRSLPAMATTLVGYVGARYAVTYWLRPHFQAPLHMTEALTAASSYGFTQTSAGLSMAAYPPSTPNAWALSAAIVDKAGHAPTSRFLERACSTLAAPPGTRRVGGGPYAHPVDSGSMQACIGHVAAKFHEVVTYQPAGRYWPFQIYETAFFVVLALALAGLSFWWIRKRLT